MAERRSSKSSRAVKDQRPLKRLIMEGTRGHILQLMVMGVLLGATVPGHRAIQTPDYDDTSTPEILNPSWMANIPDIYSISDVTMPGTHNTMALYGGTLAECNSWSLALQLRAGIRFLDIRVRHAKGNLTIHHGISYQYAHFGDVLMDVVAFLREYPSETVLMRLKEELSDTRDIYNAVVRYINEYAHWDLLWHSREMPSMGAARGKLIVLQDFTGPDLAIRYNSLDIADDWKVSSLQPEEVEKKWRSVSTHLEAAAVGNKNRMFLTYSSSASILAHPNALARLINPRLHRYLTGYVGQRKRFGIVAMDFPGAKLMQTIIGFNY
uniref:Si:dkey-266f7.9 n=1 Tax=Cyprinus carpio carpio TaxID=630221 RepID=A0A9J7XDX4_CYPCA